MVSQSQPSVAREPISRADSDAPISGGSRVIDPEMSSFLNGVIGVVDANSYERHMLWDENRRREQPKTWEQDNSGLMEIVGNVGDMPVCVVLWKATVGGHLLLFVDPTSQVVDHRMIDKWLAEAMPPTAFREGSGFVNRADAMNFHNVFPRTLPTGQSRATSERPPSPRDAIEKDPTPNPKGAE